MYDDQEREDRWTPAPPRKRVRASKWARRLAFQRWEREFVAAMDDDYARALARDERARAQAAAGSTKDGTPLCIAAHCGRPVAGRRPENGRWYQWCQPHLDELRAAPGKPRDRAAALLNHTR